MLGSCLSSLHCFTPAVCSDWMVGSPWSKWYSWGWQPSIGGSVGSSRKANAKNGRWVGPLWSGTRVLSLSWVGDTLLCPGSAYYYLWPLKRHAGSLFLKGAGWFRPYESSQVLSCVRAYSSSRALTVKLWKELGCFLPWLFRPKRAKRKREVGKYLPSF